MKKEQMIEQNPGFFINGEKVEWLDLVEIIRKEGLMNQIIKNFVLDKELCKVRLIEEEAEKIFNEYKRNQNITDDQSYQEFLERNFISERVLKEVVLRPHKIVKYREERWGPRASSIYLKNKSSYDMITYRKLESSNEEAMQEIYFRLKDKEDTWETIARGFPGANRGANARFGPISAQTLPLKLLQALKDAGVGKLIRPLRLDNNMVAVAVLEKLENSKFDDNIRAQLLKNEFDKWLQEECKRANGKVEVI